MKIAYIGQKGIPAKFGGVEKHVEELTVRLARKGHDVFVYARNNYTDKHTKKYKGVKIVNLPSIPTKNLDAISHTFLATVHALFQNYDIIHYQAIGPTSLSFIIKIFKRKTKLVATHHCQDYYHQKWNFFARAYLKFGEYVTCTIPDKTIVVSKILAEHIWNNFKNRAAIINNGMDVKSVEKSSYLDKWDIQKGSYILSVGRLIRHKGIHYLIKAFKNLEDKHLTRGKKLVIVGDGFYTDDYVKEIKDMARGRKNIIFTGSQTGEVLEQLFSHAYLFVQPSESEGLSLALLEAMGYGKAVLSSDIKENMEAVDKFTGVSFHSGDADDLENKLVEMINNPDLIKKMGERAMSKARVKYSWDNIANEIEELYRDILIQKRKKLILSESNERNL